LNLTSKNTPSKTNDKVNAAVQSTNTADGWIYVTSTKKVKARKEKENKPSKTKEKQ